MKRKIQFRGYNLKNKKWLYGYYLVNRGKSYIVQDEVVDPFAVPEDFEVAPESVGQFIGAYKGKPIYEGDILRVNENGGYKAEYKGVAKYDVMKCGFMVGCPQHINIPITGDIQTGYIGMGASHEYYYVYEVVGNEYVEKMKHPDKHTF